MSNNVFDLSGKVAIVTGASRGLGQYLGRALAHAGADLVITARKLESLEPFRKEIEGLGRRAVPLELDVLAAAAQSLGHDADHCRELASANTARHALEIIARKGSHAILESIARMAAAQSARLAGDGAQIRLLLFNYDGRLLVDVK